MRGIEVCGWLTTQGLCKLLRMAAMKRVLTMKLLFGDDKIV